MRQRDQRSGDSGDQDSYYQEKGVKEPGGPLFVVSESAEYWDQDRRNSAANDNIEQHVWDACGNFERVSRACCPEQGRDDRLTDETEQSA